MNKLEALNKAYREIKRKKRLHGYQYGKTDCWNLFTLYDQTLRGNSTLHGLITDYPTHVAFHKKVKSLGYKDAKDLLLQSGYQEVNFEEAETGDVCVFNSPVVDFTIAIFDGSVWINSSDSDRYEQLPSRYVSKKLCYTLRPEVINA